MFNSEVVSSHEVSMRRCFRAISASWLFMMILTLSLLVLFLPRESQAFEATSAKSLSGPSSEDSLKVQKDKCLSLLHRASFDVVPYTSKESVTSGRSAHLTGNLTRRHAEKATALALLLGVRIALGPKEELRRSANSANYMKTALAPQLMVKEGASNSNSKVISVRAYRNCKKQEALSALNAWRWSR